MYEKILSPIQMGTLTLKNRIVFAPTTMGLPQDVYFEKLGQIAAGGCAMIVIGDVPVMHSKHGHSLYSRKGFAYYQKLVSLVHGDRMCGSFSSSVYNHRMDEYGGTPHNRARFAIEAVSAIRKKLPDYPIDYKLAVRQENPHYGNAGVQEEELPVFVPLLEAAGVTSFYVTLADHSDLSDCRPRVGKEGRFREYCGNSKVCAMQSAMSGWDAATQRSPLYLRDSVK